MLMAISGVLTWWAKNILNEIQKVRIFATIGIISASLMVMSLW